MGVHERKAREFDRREREILSAALALFRRPDWQAVTIDQIAARAEIGKGTIYKHFATKDEIYGRLALDFYRGLLASLRNVDLNGDFARVLRALVRAFWDRHVRLAPEEQRVVQYCERPDFLEQLPQGTRAALRDVNAETSNIVGAFLERAMADGAIERRPLGVVMYLLQASVLGAIRMAWTGCIRSGQEEQYVNDLTDFVAAGLVSSNARQAQAG